MKRIITIIAMLLIIALSAVVVVYLIQLRQIRDDPARAFISPTSTLNPNTGSQLSQTPQQTESAEYAAMQSDGIITLVLLGIDSNAQREDEGMGYRSDTIAVIALDTKVHSCTVLNIPRDTYARVRKLDKDGSVKAVENNKINAAFALCSDKYRHQNALAAIEELLFGTEGALEYYASIDMDGIGPLTEAVGGVDVTLETDVPDVGSAGETVTLNSETAFIFVRKRHGLTGGSDISRITRQQTYMRALASKVKSLGLMQIPGLWSRMNGYVQTNLSLAQVIVLYEQLSKLDINRIEFITLPGKAKTMGGTSYYIVDKEAAAELVTRIW